MVHIIQINTDLFLLYIQNLYLNFFLRLPIYVTLPQKSLYLFKLKSNWSNYSKINKYVYIINNKVQCQHITMSNVKLS